MNFISELIDKTTLIPKICRDWLSRKLIFRQETRNRKYSFKILHSSEFKDSLKDLLTRKRAFTQAMNVITLAPINANNRVATGTLIFQVRYRYFHEEK